MTFAPTYILYRGILFSGSGWCEGIDGACDALVDQEGSGKVLAQLRGNYVQQPILFEVLGGTDRSNILAVSYVLRVQNGVVGRVKGVHPAIKRTY